MDSLTCQGGTAAGSLGLLFPMLQAMESNLSSEATA